MARVTLEVDPTMSDLDEPVITLSMADAEPRSQQVLVPLGSILWLVISRGIAGVTGIPLGLLLMLAVYVFALRRALQDGATIGARSIAQA